MISLAGDAIPYHSTTRHAEAAISIEHDCVRRDFDPDEHSRIRMPAELVEAATDVFFKYETLGPTRTVLLVVFYRRVHPILECWVLDLAIARNRQLFRIAVIQLRSHRPMTSVDTETTFWLFVINAEADGVDARSCL